MSKSQVTISAAAILQDGKVYTGKRHHLIIRDIAEQTGIRPVTGRQGFVTSNGRFVGRKQAARIALQAGQITKLKYDPEELFSEELWEA